MTHSLEKYGPITTAMDITWLRRLKAFGPKSALEIPMGTITRLGIAGFIGSEEVEGVISARYGARIMRHIRYRINQQGEDFLTRLKTDEPGDHE